MAQVAFSLLFAVVLAISSATLFSSAVTAAAAALDKSAELASLEG